MWGHAVIFAGDRRLKAREGGLPRSRIRMVEGCTETFCFSRSHLLGWPTSAHLPSPARVARTA